MLSTAVSTCTIEREVIEKRNEKNYSQHELSLCVCLIAKCTKQRFIKNENLVMRPSV